MIHAPRSGPNVGNAEAATRRTSRALPNGRMAVAPHSAGHSRAQSSVDGSAMAPAAHWDGAASEVGASCRRVSIAPPVADHNCFC